MILFLAPLLAALVSHDCDTVIDAMRLRIRPHSYDFYDMPMGDRTAYPAADAIVTCRIEATGSLADCASDLSGVRGPWLVRQVRFWKVLDTELDGCLLAGRQLQLRFRFLEQDGGPQLAQG